MPKIHLYHGEQVVKTYKPSMWAYFRDFITGFIFVIVGLYLATSPIAIISNIFRSVGLNYWYLYTILIAIGIVIISIYELSRNNHLCLFKRA